MHHHSDRLREIHFNRLQRGEIPKESQRILSLDRRECRPALRRSEILRPRISGNPASDQKAASAAAQSRSTPKSRCQKQQGAGPAFSVAFIVAAYSRGSTVKTTSFSCRSGIPSIDFSDCP